MTPSELHDSLLALAESLDACEWNHPLLSAEACRSAADLILTQAAAVNGLIVPQVERVLELEAEMESAAKRIAELETENTLQAATINGLRLPRCDMDGRTLEELSKENATLRDENARLSRLLADAAKEGE